MRCQKMPQVSQLIKTFLRLELFDSCQLYKCLKVVKKGYKSGSNTSTDIVNRKVAS